MTRPPGFFVVVVVVVVVWGGGEPKWKEKGVQTANFIMEGEVWAQDYKMQTLVH